MLSVSVVIPVYNLAAYLPEAIESVLRQSYQPLEIIVVDDGSTDDTELVLRAYWQKIVYLKQERKGAAAARNRGIQGSSGKYIAFLDADDLWMPDRLQEQVRYLDEDPEVGLVCSDFSVVSDSGSILPSLLNSCRNARSGYVFNEVIQDYFILTSSAMIRRSCLDETGLFDESLEMTEDRDLWLRIGYRWKIVVVHKPLVIKRNRPGSLSSNPTLAAASRVKVFEKALQRFPDLSSRSRQLLRTQMAADFWDLGYHHFNQLSLKEARKNFLCSLENNWRSAKAWVFLIACCLPAPAVRILRSAKRAFAPVNASASSRGL